MYINYGDIDFFESGTLVEEISPGIYDMICCRPYSDREDLYQFARLTVDINDPWIDKESVMSYIGMGEWDPVWFAIGCTEYYSWDNFGADDPTYDWRQMSRREVENELTLSGIEI